MNKVIEQLKKDIQEAEAICKKLSIHSTEYNYWNGCRCQAEATLKFITSDTDTLYGKGFESNIDLTNWNILNPRGSISNE